MAKRMPGLFRRKNVWWISKQINGQRVQRSTGTSDYAEAERYLTYLMEGHRRIAYYGEQRQYTFEEAAVRYVTEQTKASLPQECKELMRLNPFIGKLPLKSVHMGTLQPFIKKRRADGVKNRTINLGLQVVRRILNLSASEWLDQEGRPWLEHAPKIKLLSEKDRKPPFPLSWEEQERLFAELPEYLRLMATFKVNTGCRDQEVCKLQWDWEVRVPAFDTSIFVIPWERVKNRQDRVVVLNEDAIDVIERVRGQHSEYVFTFRGRPIRTMMTTSWKNARQRAGLPDVRVHDLKHTFGRRLRAVGVSFEDRQDLLGHKSERITTHYSMAELQGLISAANRVCKRAVAADHYNSATIDVLRRNKGYLRVAK